MGNEAPLEALPIEELRRVQLRPGDTLVAKLSRTTTKEMAEDVSAALRAIFPDNRVVVLSQEIELEVVSAEPDP